MAQDCTGASLGSTIIGLINEQERQQFPQDGQIGYGRLTLGMESPDSE